MSSLQYASRAARSGLADRMENVARSFRRRGRYLVATAIEGAAYGIRRGGVVDAAGYAWGSLVDEIEARGDYEWAANQVKSFGSRAASGVVLGGVGAIGSLVQSDGRKRVRSSDLPVEQRYKKLKVVPVHPMSMEDETAFDLVSSMPSCQVPRLSTLARRQVAANKRREWLVRHTRKARAAYLQSKYIPARLYRARDIRRRFVRSFVRRYRKKVGKRKRRY